jgi:hypothetical protein
MRFSPADNGKHYTNHTFKNTDFDITRFDFEDWLPPVEIGADASADYVNTEYAATGIEVVLETLFDDSRWHLTEKSLRPIACGQPFILAATPGSLEYLRSYGFETFAGLINESYDLIDNPAERLEAIVNEMKRIALLPKKFKEELFAKLQHIASRNQKRFFSKEFTKHIIDEFKNNFDAGFKKLSI